MKVFMKRRSRTGTGHVKVFKKRSGRTGAEGGSNNNLIA